MADDVLSTPKPAAKKAPAARPAATQPETSQSEQSGQSGTAQVKSAFAGLTDTTTQSLKDGAAKLTKDATDKARAYAEDGKARAGGALDELSRMMNDAASTVDEKVGAQYGQYARSAADAVSNFSESLKSKNIDDLLGEAREFARKSPAVAIGTAAALGFVLVRLIKSGLDSDTHA